MPKNSWQEGEESANIDELSARKARKSRWKAWKKRDLKKIKKFQKNAKKRLTKGKGLWYDIQAVAARGQASEAGALQKQIKNRIRKKWELFDKQANKGNFR